MHGVDIKEGSGRYGSEIAIMKSMGWSWPDLMNAPSDLVDEILTKLISSNKWSEKRTKETRKK